MPDAVAGKARAKSRLYWWRFRPDLRSRRERGPHIDRHPMGRCAAFCLRSSTAIRTTIPDAAVARSARYGAAKGCRVSFFMVFGRFLCETQPNRCRVFCRVSMGYYGFSLLVDLLARGCPRVELRAKIPKTGCGCGSRSSKLLARPVGSLRPHELASGSKTLASSSHLIWLERPAFASALSRPFKP